MPAELQVQCQMYPLGSIRYIRHVLSRLFKL